MAPKPQSFCKIFFGDLLPNHISLPTEFVKKHRKVMVREICRLRTESGRNSWNVKVEQIDNDLCVTDGWSQFVTDNDIRFTDFLLFRLVGKLTLEVVVYRRDGCLKDPISANPHHHNSDAASTSRRRGKAVGGLTFSTIIKKHGASYLHVPKDFAKETGIVSKTEIILVNLRGKEWRVEINHNRKESYNRISLCRGWPEFRTQNGLVTGTEYWFQFNPSSGNLVLTNGPPQTSSRDKLSTVHPSFFKVLFNNDYDQTLRLPLAFSNEYGKRLSKNSKLVAESGETWNVDLEVVDGKYYCFTNGWDQFANDFKLAFEEFLVFGCDVDKSEFHVSVHGVCGCERHLPVTKNRPMKDEYEEDESASGSSSEEVHPHFTVCLKTHMISRVPLRKGFVEAAGLTGENSVMLQYPPNEVCRSVKMDRVIMPRKDHQLYRFELRRGWSKFREANGLVFGQNYLFEYNEDKNVIQVKLITSGEETSS